MMIETRFELTDHYGKHVSIGDYAGTYPLIYFGFTHCRVVCPRALSRISEALTQLKNLTGSAADSVRPLYISVDPERDTPDVMRHFLQERYPLFTGLTGTQAQVNAAKQAFRVFAQKKTDDEDPDGYAVPHTAFTYLLDKQGHYVTHYPDHWDAERLATDLAARIQ